MCALSLSLCKEMRRLSVHTGSSSTGRKVEQRSRRRAWNVHQERAFVRVEREVVLLEQAFFLQTFHISTFSGEHGGKCNDVIQL
jgi:hypothetical protein